MDRAPGTHCIGGWVDPRAGLEAMEKNLLPLLGIAQPRFLGHPAHSLVTMLTDLCEPQLYSVNGANHVYLWLWAVKNECVHMVSRLPSLNSQQEPGLFFLSQRSDRLWDPPSPRNGCLGLFLRGKSAGAWSLLPSSAEIKNDGGIPRLLHTFSWLGA
jgi:hypothetical protein